MWGGGGGYSLRAAEKSIGSPPQLTSQYGKNAFFGRLAWGPLRMNARRYGVITMQKPYTFFEVSARIEFTHAFCIPLKHANLCKGLSSSIHRPTLQPSHPEIHKGRIQDGEGHFEGVIGKRKR